MATEEPQLEEGLREIGEKLLRQSDDVGEVLQLLDRAESLLAKIEQSPPPTMSAALQPVMRALVSKDLFQHADADVKVAVASCVSEITRITAPEAPYDDEKMKGVFEMIVEAFKGLDDISGRSFSKRVSVLETVAKVRLCVVMLDLECDDLILQMFKYFLHTVRDEHSENVFSLMEMIMRVVIEESEEVQPDVIHCLLDSVKKENKDVLPIARKLGEKVIANNAEKLKAHILEALKSKDATFSDYSGIVSSICTGNALVIDKSDMNPNSQCSEDESKQSEKTVSKEHAQRSDKMDAEDPSPEVGTRGDKSPKSAVCNGIVSDSPDRQTEKPDSSKKSDKVKSIPSNKVIKKSKVQKKNSSLVSTDATDDMLLDGEKSSAKTPINSVTENTHDNSRPKRGRPPSSKLSTKKSTTDTPALGRRKSNDADEGEINVKSVGTSKKVHDAGGDTDVKSSKSFGKKKSETNDQERETSDAHLKNENVKISDDEVKPVKEMAKKSEKPNEEKKEQTPKGRPRMKKDSDKDETFMEMVSSPNTSRKTKGAKDQSHSKEKQESKKNAKWVRGTEDTKVWGEELVGCSINVWWPDDKEFYRGVVDSYNQNTKRHKVLYADGDVEVLLLKDEQWKFVDDDLSDEEAGKDNTDIPSPDVDDGPLKKQKINPETKQVSSGKRGLNPTKVKGDASGASLKSNVSLEAVGSKTKGKSSSVSNKLPGTPNSISRDDSLQSAKGTKSKDDAQRIDNDSNVETPKSARKSKDGDVKSSTGKMEKCGMSEKSARKAKIGTPKSSGKANINGNAAKGTPAEEIEDAPAKGPGSLRKRGRATKS